MLKITFLIVFLLSISIFTSAGKRGKGRNRNFDEELTEPTISYPCSATRSFQMHVEPERARRGQGSDSSGESDSGSDEKRRRGPTSWNGYLLLQEFPRVQDLTLHLTFSCKAKVKVDRRKGRILNKKKHGRHISIKFYDTLDCEYVQFQVERHRQRDELPKLLSILLGDREICTGSPSTTTPAPNYPQMPFNAGPTSNPPVNPFYGPHVEPIAGPTSNQPMSPSYGPQDGPTSNQPVRPSYGPQVGPTSNPSMNPSYGPQVGPTSNQPVRPSYGPQVGPTSNPSMNSSYGPQVGLTSNQPERPSYGPQVGSTSNQPVSPSFGPQVGPTSNPSMNSSYGPQVGLTSNQPVRPSYGPQVEPIIRPIFPNDHPVWKDPPEVSIDVRSFQDDLPQRLVALDNDPEDCGRRMLRNSPLITHGYGSQPGEWPWHAAIYHRRGSNLIYKCGGVLISETVVLTAAHCLLENGLVITPERLLVQLGKHNLNTARPETRDLEVYQLRVHQNFSQSDLCDDLALLKLAQQAERSEFIQPVCLWPANETDLAPLVLGGEAGYVAGWGMTETGSSPNELREGRLPVVDYMTCLESNRDFFGAVLNGRNFCAGYRNGTNACNGDSGSGMFFKDKESGRWRMRGIVSVGTVRRAKDICDPLNYVVFTDVARYGDWIKRYI